MSPVSSTPVHQTPSVDPVCYCPSIQTSPHWCRTEITRYCARTDGRMPYLFHPFLYIRRPQWTLYAAITPYKHALSNVSYRANNILCTDRRTDASPVSSIPVHQTPSVDPVCCRHAVQTHPHWCRTVVPAVQYLLHHAH